MDLFDAIKEAELTVNQPFNMEEWKGGKPAITVNGTIAYYAGPANHPLHSDKLLMVCPVTVSNRNNLGKDTETYMVNSEGLWEGYRHAAMSLLYMQA